MQQRNFFAPHIKIVFVVVISYVVGHPHAGMKRKNVEKREREKNDITLIQQLEREKKNI